MIKEKVKVSVNLLDEDVEILKGMSRQRGTNMTEILRRAIATEKFFFDELRDGKSKLLIEDENKNIKQIVLR